MDCGGMRADDRLATKRAGIEPGRTGLPVEGWKRALGRKVREMPEDNTMNRNGVTHQNRGTHASKKGPSSGHMTETGSEDGGRTRVWEKGNWTRSSGSKRRVYVPDEHRGAKRYAKNNGRKLALITYNAMCAANGARLRAISQTSPWAVVGVHGG